MLENNKQLRKAPVPSLATWSKNTTQPNSNSGGITDRVSKLFITITDIGVLRYYY
jgi:hypothetical protein